MANKKNSSSDKGIKVIQVNVIDNLLVDGSVADICNTTRGLQKICKVRKNEVMRRVENGDGIAAQAIGVMSLSLPSRFILELSNCYFIPRLCKNIISGSCLINDGYSYKSENNGFSIYYKDMLYGFAPIIGGLFNMNLECEKHVYNINVKRLKRTDNTTYMWHRCLGQIRKKHIQKPHKDGVLTSFDFESFDACEACLMG